MWLEDRQVGNHWIVREVERGRCRQKEKDREGERKRGIGGRQGEVEGERRI
jgi:hypothetical protein